MDITQEPSVVTVGVFHGGVRHNIIPDEVKLEGTIRTFDEKQRDRDPRAREAHHRDDRGSRAARKARRAHPPLVRRDGERSRRSPSGRVPTLAARRGRRQRAASIDKVCGAEDFSFFQKEVPGLLLLHRLHAARARRDEGARPTTARASTSTRTCLKLGIEDARRARARLARLERQAVTPGDVAALLAQGQREEALAAAAREVNENPQDAGWRVVLGAVLVEMQQLAEGEKVLRDALRMAPDAPEALFNLSVALRRQGRAEEQVDLARANPADMAGRGARPCGPFAGGTLPAHVRAARRRGARLSRAARASSRARAPRSTTWRSPSRRSRAATTMWRP